MPIFKAKSAEFEGKCIFVELSDAVYRESTKILYSVQNAYDFCIERYGNLTNQQFFPVNGPFVSSCLDIICVNLMRFTCFWTFKFIIIDFVPLISGTGVIRFCTGH